MTEKKRLDTSRPFRRADALTDGISAKTLRGPRFRTIFRGVQIAACVKVTPKVRAEAALRLFDPSAFASHASAARLLDVPIPTLPDEHVTVFHQRMRRHHRGIRTHVSDTMDVRKVDGVLLSDHARMFVELAELIGLVDLVVVGDHLVRKGWITCVDLVAYCATSTHRAARAARRAAGYVRADVDSPMETRLRMLLVLAGLPEPAINVRIRAADGEVMRRYDLSFPEARVIVEYDGRQHIERVETWEADLERREAIDDDGWRILVVVASGIYTSPERTLLRVCRLLRARGHDAVPAQLDDEWRAHFPGHAGAI